MTEFAEPWEAQTFALAVALSDAGRVSWPELAGGEDYLAMLSALERAVCEHGLTDPDTLAAYRAAWAYAAHRTPHGEPIELDPADFHAAGRSSWRTGGGGSRTFPDRQVNRPTPSR